MKVLVVFLLSVCWGGLVSANPLIADVLRARNNGVGSMRTNPPFDVMLPPFQEEANYSFQYDVQDAQSGQDFGHREAMSSGTATGSFYQRMADGRMQRVEYVADRDGYRPRISYEGEPRFGSQLGIRGF